MPVTNISGQYLLCHVFESPLFIPVPNPSSQSHNSPIAFAFLSSFITSLNTTYPFLSRYSLALGSPIAKVGGVNGGVMVWMTFCFFGFEDEEEELDALGVSMLSEVLFLVSAFIVVRVCDRNEKHTLSWAFMLEFLEKETIFVGSTFPFVKLNLPYARLRLLECDGGECTCSLIFIQLIDYL